MTKTLRRLGVNVGRKATTIPVNPAAFRTALYASEKTLEQAGEILGVSRQAIHQWLVSERIPPRRLADLSQVLGWSVEQVESMCDWQDSPKDLMRENIRLREEINTLGRALCAFLGDSR